MRNILFLLFLIGCIGMPANVGRDVGRGVVSTSLDSTIALIKEGEVSPYCTGVWVGGDYILTAYHCVMPSLEELLQMNPEELILLDSKKINYITQSDNLELFEKPSILREAIVVGLDPKLDLALLRVSGDIPLHMVVQIADKVNVGERVHIVGHVQGLSWTYMEGVLSAQRIKDGVSLLQVSAPIYFGVSGGGGFNDMGELLGITSFIFKAPNIGFLIDNTEIKKFLSLNLKK